MEQKPSRATNLELFRIITMLLIVAHHYVVNSGLSSIMHQNPSALRSLFLFVFGAWGKTGINCFLLITGYFMCTSKITVKKFAKLYLELAFYKMAVYAVFGLLGISPFSLKGFFLSAVSFMQYVGTGFFCAYLLFYLCIPFLNILINGMTQKMHLLLLALLGYIYIFCATWPSASVTMNYVSWFSVIYLIGAYLRLYPVPLLESTRITGLSTIVLLVLAIYSVISGATSGDSKQVYYYLSDSNKILAVLISVSAFLYFKNLKIGYSPFINRISASTFGVLCIHANSDAMRKWLWVDTLKNTQVYYHSGVVLVIHAILSVTAVFCICTVIDQLRILLLEKHLFSLWDRIEAKFLSKKAI